MLKMETYPKFQPGGIQFVRLWMIVSFAEGSGFRRRLVSSFHHST